MIIITSDMQAMICGEPDLAWRLYAHAFGLCWVAVYRPVAIGTRLGVGAVVKKELCG